MCGERRRCFQGTITLILATDMARHGEILDSFKQKVDNFDYTDEEHVTCVRGGDSKRADRKYSLLMLTC